MCFDSSWLRYGLQDLPNGKMGFTRNLTSGEIVGQLLEVRRQVPDSAVTNVVLMGMENPSQTLAIPFLAIKIMTNPNGPQISWRHLTVSTSGLVPQMFELGQSVRVKLAVSLNAVSNEVRSLIMPINQKYPLYELISAMRDSPCQDVID